MHAATFDCLRYLHLALEKYGENPGGVPHDDVLLACLQADATRTAAKIDARASTLSAWFALVGGVGVLGAGYLTYLSAIRQVRLSEQDYQRRLASRALKILHLLRKRGWEMSSLLADLRLAPSMQTTNAAISVTIPSEQEQLGEADYQLLGIEPARQLDAIGTMAGKIRETLLKHPLRFDRNAEPWTAPNGFQTVDIRLDVQKEILLGFTKELTKYAQNCLSLTKEAEKTQEVLLKSSGGWSKNVLRVVSEKLGEMQSRLKRGR